MSRDAFRRSLPFLMVAGFLALFATLGRQEQSAAAEEPEVRGPAASTTVATVAVAQVGQVQNWVRQGPTLLAEDDPLEFGVPIAIEDPSGQAMRPLHDALRRVQQGQGQARLLFYGASHVASDLFTGRLRDRLQARFGDAGHGVILPAHPWHTYRHQRVRVDSSRALWRGARVRATDDDVDSYGIAGAYVEASSRDAYGKIRTAEEGAGLNASLFDLHFWKRPGGGSFDVHLDGVLRETVTTDGPEGAGYATYRLPDGPHELEVRLRGDGLVRLFGTVVERDVPGVVVDTAGVNGARARDQLYWNDALFREHLARRAPNLVVLAYGTNESGDDLPMEDYVETLDRVLRRVRETVPNAACLLIGPSDRPIRIRGGVWQARPRTTELNDAQFRAAAKYGCGFFDLVAFGGGPMSAVQWANGPTAGVGPDHVHFNRHGYERLGDVLHDALMVGFE